MLLIIIILLVVDILLNLAGGFLLVAALGELGTLRKYRFEFGPVLSATNKDDFE